MKQIKDYPDYYVTEDGKVYSKKYHHTQNPNCELREKKLSKTKNGYLQVGLNKDGKRKTVSVHRLVGLTYILNPDNLPEVEHRDCNKTNNHISNLEWVTHSENIKRTYKNGLKSTKGEKNGRSKLTETQVKWIRENYIPFHKEFGCTALLKKFDVSFQLISRIINNKTWKHI